MVSQSKVVSQSHRQSLNGAVIWFQALWRKLKLLWDVVLLNAVTTEVGCDFRGVESLHLVNIISLQAQRGSGEGSPPPPSPPPPPRIPFPWSTSQKTNNPQSSMAIQIQKQPFPSKRKTKQESATVDSFFFFVIRKEKQMFWPLQRSQPPKKENHLTSLLRFMSSGRTLTLQTGRRFCLLNQLGFLGGSGRSAPGTWETFFFGAPPDSAPSVGLKSQQLRLGLALLPASVTLQCQHSGSFTGDQPRLRG